MKSSIFDVASINAELSKPTSIFGLRLWIVIGLILGSLIVIALFLLSLCLSSRRNKRPRKHKSTTLPISKDVHHPTAAQIQVEIGKNEHRVVLTDKQPLIPSSGNTVSGETVSDSASIGGGPEVWHLGWGKCFTLRELEEATGSFVDENVIGEGGYGIVYHGALSDGTTVGVKNLLNNN